LLSALFRNQQQEQSAVTTSQHNRSTAHARALGVALIGASAFTSACQPAAAATPSKAVAQASAEPVATPESVQAGDAVLRGTLLTPVSIGKPPVALIIAGSGPTDRDGNSPLLPGKNNSLKLLAEGLAGRGIASLRYDKRGIAGSTLGVTGEQDLTFRTFSDDAVAWSERLAADDRFSDLVIVGHSEGALIGILAAQTIPPTKLVSIAGLGRPAGTVLREQLGRQLSGEMLATADSIISVLERGERVDSVPQILLVLFRPSVQPYLSSFLRITPAAEVAKVAAPVLVIHGSTDAQIARSDAETLAASAPDATLRIFDGMNHVLKPAPAGLPQQVAAYTDSTIALAPGLVDTIAAFIRRR
jgi:alpha-beta hydrolase superfamily lysophospholipase